MFSTLEEGVRKVSFSQIDVEIWLAKTDRAVKLKKETRRLKNESNYSLDTFLFRLRNCVYE